uniref:RING-type domain-containing protein n=1 Tax=Leersia perrieri TaxID=77586 RepID=A0A0D9X327_9ORYZ
MEMSVMNALLLILLAVAARRLAELAMRKLITGDNKTAASAAAEQLRVARYSGGGGECAVCLSGVEEGDEVRELRCRHLFHRGCIDRWLLITAAAAATCPLCRCRLLLPTTSPAATAEAEADEDYYGCDGDDEESGMVMFMAYVRSSSTWL